MLKVFHTGVWGAGLAQVIGDAVGYAIGLSALTAQARQDGGHLSWRRRFQKLRELWPVVRLGGPLTIDSVIHGTVWFGLIAFLARYGAEYVAAQGAEERLTQILNLPTEGVAPAAVTLVGYMMGRGRRKDALRVVWMSLGAVGAVALVGAALLRLTPAPVVAWLCNDPAFVHVGVKMLAIAAIGLAFVGGRDVMEASFGGIGDTVPPVLVGIGVALSRFPIAYLLAVKLGAGGLGVAWAVNGTLMAQTLVLIGWFLLRFRKMKGMEIETIPTSLPPSKIPDETAA
jgi:Na+-driven multidrug efflux pump